MYTRKKEFVIYLSVGFFLGGGIGLGSSWAQGLFELDAQEDELAWLEKEMDDQLNGDTDEAWQRQEQERIYADEKALTSQQKQGKELEDREYGQLFGEQNDPLEGTLLAIGLVVVLFLTHHALHWPQVRRSLEIPLNANNSHTVTLYGHGRSQTPVRVGKSLRLWDGSYTVQQPYGLPDRHGEPDTWLVKKDAFLGLSSGYFFLKKTTEKELTFHLLTLQALNDGEKAWGAYPSMGYQVKQGEQTFYVLLKASPECVAPGQLRDERLPEALKRLWQRKQAAEEQGFYIAAGGEGYLFDQWYALQDDLAANQTDQIASLGKSLFAIAYQEEIKKIAEEQIVASFFKPIAQGDRDDYQQGLALAVALEAWGEDKSKKGLMYPIKRRIKEVGALAFLYQLKVFKRYQEQLEGLWDAQEENGEHLTTSFAYNQQTQCYEATFKKADDQALSEPEKQRLFSHFFTRLADEEPDEQKEAALLDNILEELKDKCWPGEPASVLIDTMWQGQLDEDGLKERLGLLEDREPNQEPNEV